MSDEVEILRGEGIRVSDRQITINDKAMSTSDIMQFNAEEFGHFRLQKKGIVLLNVALVFFILAGFLQAFYLAVIAACCIGVGLAQYKKVKTYKVVIVGNNKKLTYTTAKKENTTLFISAIQTAKEMVAGNKEIER